MEVGKGVGGGGREANAEVDVDMLRGYVDVWKRGFLEPRARCPLYPLPLPANNAAVVVSSAVRCSLFAAVAVVAREYSYLFFFRGVGGLAGAMWCRCSWVGLGVR